MARRLIPLMFVLVMLLAACGPDEVIIPTVMDLDAIVAVTETFSAEQTAAYAPPTLPPTWTPSAVPSATLPPTLVATLTPSAVPQPGQIVFVADGALYSVRSDGSAFGPLTDFLGIRDVTLSPDRRFIAFVSTGAGSAQEIYIYDLSTGGLLQVTRLGYAEMHTPAWHPGGERLAFAAGQYEDGIRELYAINLDGSGLVQISDFGAGQGNIMAAELANLAYTPDGEGLIFAAPSLTLWNLVVDEVTQLTLASSFGPDRTPLFLPDSDELFYIRTDSSQTEIMGGPVHGFRLSDFRNTMIPPVMADLFVQSFDLAADGRRMALSSAFTIYMLDFTSRSARQVAQSGVVLPYAALSPDSQRMAYWFSAAGMSEEILPALVTDKYSGGDVQVVLDNMNAAELGQILWISADR